MRSLFIRQFFTTAMLLLISFLLIGATFLTLSNQYILSEQQDVVFKRRNGCAVGNGISNVWRAGRQLGF